MGNWVGQEVSGDNRSHEETWERKIDELVGGGGLFTPQSDAFQSQD